MTLFDPLRKDEAEAIRQVLYDVADKWHKFQEREFPRNGDPDWKYFHHWEPAVYRILEITAGQRTGRESL